MVSLFSVVVAMGISDGTGDGLVSFVDCFLVKINGLRGNCFLCSDGGVVLVSLSRMATDRGVVVVVVVVLSDDRLLDFDLAFANAASLDIGFDCSWG